MYRWEQFPLRVSIDSGSLSIVGEAIGTYQDAIREGVVVWGAATGGVIGDVKVGFDLPDADVLVRLRDTDDDGDCDLFLACDGRFKAEVIESERVLRRGTILIFPRNIQPPAGDLRRYLANLVGHEMGHALGLSIHSENPADLMYGRPERAAGRPYPWVTERDLNTVGTAYCR